MLFSDFHIDMLWYTHMGGDGGKEGEINEVGERIIKLSFKGKVWGCDMWL